MMQMQNTTVPMLMVQQASPTMDQAVNYPVMNLPRRPSMSMTPPSSPETPQQVADVVRVPCAPPPVHRANNKRPYSQLEQQQGQGVVGGGLTPPRLSTGSRAQPTASPEPSSSPVKAQAPISPTGGEIRRCTSCSSRKPVACFNIGKVTCDDCCIKKRRLSKERTKQKQTLKLDLDAMTARVAKLEEENRILRAGGSVLTTSPALLHGTPDHSAPVASSTSVAPLEAENRRLRQQLLQLQMQSAQIQARFESVQALLGVQIAAPQPQGPPESAVEETQEETAAAQDAASCLAVLAQAAEHSPKKKARGRGGGGR